MLQHLKEVMEEVHPLRNYWQLFIDATTGIPVELGKKGQKSWQEEKYLHSCLCFSLAATYVALLVGIAMVFVPWFKAMIMMKLASSPTIAFAVTKGCKIIVRKVIGKIVRAIDQKFL